MKTTLDKMIPGQKGSVVAMDQKESIKQRLLEMGLTLDSEVEFKRTAPFGDPIRIKVRGSLLAIRKKIASKITMTTEDR